MIEVFGHGPRRDTPSRSVRSEAFNHGFPGSCTDSAFALETSINSSCSAAEGSVAEGIAGYGAGVRTHHYHQETSCHPLKSQDGSASYDSM